MIGCKQNKLLIRFLKDNNVFHYCYSMNLKIKSYRYPIEQFINIMFYPWVEKKENILFWYQLHLNWHLFLLSNGYKITIDKHIMLLENAKKIHSIYLKKIHKKDYTPIKIITL